MTLPRGVDKPPDPRAWAPSAPGAFGKALSGAHPVFDEHKRFRPSPTTSEQRIMEGKGAIK
jgi:hypothetical protein